jgi:hypothetical protein
MRVFKCAHCGQLVYFENTFCERCGHSLGFDTQSMELCTLVPSNNHQFFIYGKGNDTFSYCYNHQYSVCNWLVPSSSQDIFCKACSLNKTIPNLLDYRNLPLWQMLENAKHRLVYSLLKLQLPIRNKRLDPTTGLAFDFLADFDPSNRVITGHSSGLITINIEEADDAVRERNRTSMGEPYRTLLGHFRHETGHYYWDILVKNSHLLEEFRTLFGYEQYDYSEALANYYRNGPPLNWMQQNISAYASSHPWEDWAESWAHYMHMMDTLETAYAFGLDVTPYILNPSEGVRATMDIDPYYLADFNDIIKRWLPFTYAMNSINRSMGYRDLYPFVMSEPVIKKLAFIHLVCQQYIHQK